MKFGNCTGIAINFDKTEILILRNSVVVPIQDRSTGNIEIKEAVKFLGVYFTYNRSLRQKFHRNNRCHQNETPVVEVEESDNHRGEFRLLKLL